MTPCHNRFLDHHNNQHNTSKTKTDLPAWREIRNRCSLQIPAIGLILKPETAELIYFLRRSAKKLNCGYAKSTSTWHRWRFGERQMSETNNRSRVRTNRSKLAMARKPGEGIMKIRNFERKFTWKWLNLEQERTICCHFTRWPEKPQHIS
jgi:hypothetical protein